MKYILIALLLLTIALPVQAQYVAPPKPVITDQAGAYAYAMQLQQSAQNYAANVRNQAVSDGAARANAALQAVHNNAQTLMQSAALNAITQLNTIPNIVNIPNVSPNVQATVITNAANIQSNIANNLLLPQTTYSVVIPTCPLDFATLNVNTTLNTVALPPTITLLTPVDVPPPEQPPADVPQPATTIMLPNTITGL